MNCRILGTNSTDKLRPGPRWRFQRQYTGLPLRPGAVYQLHDGHQRDRSCRLDLGSGTTQGPDTANLRFWEYQSVDTNGILVPTRSRVAWSLELDGATATNQVQNVTNWLYGWQPESGAANFQPADQRNGRARRDSGVQRQRRWNFVAGLSMAAKRDQCPVPRREQPHIDLPGAAATNASYSVVVSNAVGSVTSSLVQLTVTIPGRQRSAGPLHCRRRLPIHHLRGARARVSSLGDDEPDVVAGDQHMDGNHK